MKPSAFDYIRADTLDEALSVLADGALEAKILAGGQSLLPLMNIRLARPKTLLDVNKLDALQTIERSTMDTENGRSQTPTLLEVGALVRQRVLERYVFKEPRARLLHAALTYIGHPQTRNLGTVGGSLAHADPSAELPLIFTTLGGTAFLQSTRGERQVAAEQFFQGYFTTVIEPDELLAKTSWPLPASNVGIAFHEFRRRHGDFALVAAACVLEIDGNRRVQKVRLGIGGVAETPLLIQKAQELVGEPWTKAYARSIAVSVASRLDLADDVQASAAYRRQLATVALLRVLEGAYQDALAKEGTHAKNQG
jgi:2-furoyl-CoA dehydrogenase FAD binding subunit